MMSRQRSTLRGHGMCRDPKGSPRLDEVRIGDRVLEARATRTALPTSIWRFNAAAADRQARPQDKAKLYRRLGLQLTHAPNQSPAVTVRAEITRRRKQRIPTAYRKPWGCGTCPRGDSNPHAR